MGISAKWLKSLVGLRKAERQRHQKQNRKEDSDDGPTVRLLPISSRHLGVSWFLNWWSDALMCLLQE
jgi:hypothetical protein